MAVNCTSSPLAQRENSVRLFGPKTPGRAKAEKVRVLAAKGRQLSSLSVVDHALQPWGPCQHTMCIYDP